LVNYFHEAISIPYSRRQEVVGSVIIEGKGAVLGAPIWSRVLTLLVERCFLF